tara:strand:- start:465 stop:1127 length:663 start_codon:yes stop_codon:yes gene_type:complete
MAKFKQDQIISGVTKTRSNALKVYCAEAIAAGDVIVATGVQGDFMSVVPARATAITECRGPFFVADFAGAVGEYLPLALPYKVLTDQVTNGAAVGDAVWLSTATDGAITNGAVPAASVKGQPFSLAVKVGRVLVSHATEGVIMLEPGMANGAPLVGRVTLGAASTTVTGFTAELDGAPCVATPAGATADHATQICATIASGTLTLTHDTATDVCTFMIHA